jgi:hypothetical protein
MSKRATPATPTSNPLPRWLIVVGSVLIVFHLSSVAVRVLAAPSGPWPTPQGPNTAPPPAFAMELHEGLPEWYLRAIQWPSSATHNYHFPTNRPGQPALSFEVRLKDANGQELATVTIPDKKANFWVRHRQTLLANALGLDVPVERPQMERIPAPGKRANTVALWEPDGPNRLKLKDEDENLIIEKLQRQQGMMRPSEVTMLFLHSYVRYLCRTHGAASAEVIRHHQDPIPSVVLFDDNVPEDAFKEVLSNFGELTK